MSRIALAAALVLCLPASGLTQTQTQTQTVDRLVARNVAARGGAEVWRAVSSLRFTGRMDVGRGLLVPYVLEQKRPRKMRLEYVFDGETVVQASDGKTGWKLAPFRGQAKPEPLTQEELREAAASADPYGLLFDYVRRGHAVELLGREQVQGRDAFKLKVTLPGGAVRWVYVDGESGLEVKVDAMRRIAGREQRVETFYHDWKAADGLLVPRRYETRAEGAKASHLLTVDTVLVNPPIDNARFAMSAAVPTGAAKGR
jgi:outer membrane lipoprotein-sorting protein